MQGQPSLLERLPVDTLEDMRDDWMHELAYVKREFRFVFFFLNVLIKFIYTQHCGLQNILSYTLCPAFW